MKSLLKPEGVELFKKKVWQSMHLNAEMQEEQEVWAELVRNLREVCIIGAISNLFLAEMKLY